MSDKCDALLTGYAVRIYFFYIPLAPVIAGTFDRADLERLVRQTLLLSIPVALISILQTLEPAGAIINAGISGDPENQMRTGRSLVTRRAQRVLSPPTTDRRCSLAVFCS
jgi:hypothetical protein